MTSIDFLNREVQAIKREMRALQTQSPLESSSVSNGRLRFIGGLLRLEAGARAEIIGSLGVVGPTRLEGPWTFVGDGSIDGFLGVNGPTQIDGPTTINGNFWV